MPLAFDSLSHGRVAFGFFNVEVDLLLLERHLFYADEFCARVIVLAAGVEEPPAPLAWTVGHLRREEDLGDLMGAIHNVRLVGFIGEAYRLFPFPADRAGFKQKPYGERNRPAVTRLLEKWARPVDFTVRVDPGLKVGLGPYRFDRLVFHELIEYVWRGGYPRWRDESRPAYVLAMKAGVEASTNPLFQGLSLG
ncbi:MAG: hypothetical protein AB1896_14100 [Thermodesulfobacteriota bacterium]